MEFSSPLSSLFKRKTRGSNSPTSETISPETKRLKESVKEDQANAPPAIVSPPKSKNDSEDVVLSALNMAQDFASKVDLILSKLSQLENIGTQINVLQDSVDWINQTVANLQSEFHRLKEDVRNTVEETNTLKTSVKFLNDEVETSKRKLRDDEEKSRQELDHLRLQLLNYEVYSRRENLRFYGIPEIEGEENTEPVLKTFLEKELNVENAQSIEFQRVHRVGKKDRNTRKPRAIIARAVFALKIEKTSFLADATSIASRISVLAQIYLSRSLIWGRGLFRRWYKQEKMENGQPSVERNPINSLLTVWR